MENMKNTVETKMVEKTNENAVNVVIEEKKSLPAKIWNVTKKVVAHPVTHAVVGVLAGFAVGKRLGRRCYFESVDSKNEVEAPEIETDFIEESPTDE